MNSFLLEYNNGASWIKIPNQLIGGDASGVYPKIMESFSGMIFENMNAGSYTMPYTEFQMPNKDTVGFSANISTTVNIVKPLKICFGFLMLVNDVPFNDGEFRISTTIENTDNTPLAAFQCQFSIENGIVKNYTWRNNGPPSNPMVVRALNYDSPSRCVPVLFAIQDTAEFSDTYVVDPINYEYTMTYEIPAKWVRPKEYVINPKIYFIVSPYAIDEFYLPHTNSYNVDSVINLPTYDSLIKHNFKPLKWRIEDVDYPLGGSYTVPDHNVTAELIYEEKYYSGMAFV